MALRYVCHRGNLDVGIAKCISFSGIPLDRAISEEIVVDTNPDEGWIDAIIHWKGGIHTERRIRRRKRGDHPHHATPKLRDTIIALTHVLPDEAIAGLLNKNNIQTGRGNRWTRSHVCSFRYKRGIPPYDKDTREHEGWMTLTEAAEQLGVSLLPLRKAIQRGELPALHPLPNGPWILNRSDIETDNAQFIANQIKQRRKRGALRSPDQLNLIDSGTCPEGVV